MYVEVAIPVPRLPVLTYRHDSAYSLQPGTRVVVPLGRRTLVGVVLSTHEKAETPTRAIKAVLRVLDQEPALPQALLKLGEWIADYYQCSIGEALAAMLPSEVPATQVERLALHDPLPDRQAPRGIAQQLLERLHQGPVLRKNLLLGLPAGAGPALRALQKKGFVRSERIPDVQLTGIRALPPRDVPPILNVEQTSALEAIGSAVQARTFAPFLLHGVTGSGKTEVYLHAIEKTLAQSRGAICLVPEIALTPQTRSRIAARFGAQTEVLHSGLTPKERFAAWLRVREGHSRLVLGARSAVFAPVQNLGLIVVDEEYEGSYKQEETPRYHARDVAAVRAKHAGAVLLLGSATPSIETYYNAEQGKYRLLELSSRVDNKQLPEIRMIDMHQEIGPLGMPVFSQALMDALDQRLRAKEQSILFLNRRGYAPLVMCPVCKQVLTCPDCSVSLVYHQQIERLLCHSCGKSLAPRPACPKCGTACIRLAGTGTQRVEEELKTLFPKARVRRIDQDMARKRGAMEQALQEFGKGESDILIGTQMVAKGIDFPNVTLVGIISTDTALHLPDFRSEERTFQLLVQVAGRAGRGDRPGLVLAQTLNSSHPTLLLAQQHDYKAFYQREIEQRRDLNYPPFSRLASVVCQSQSGEQALKGARRAAEAMQGVASKNDEILGPVPSPRERIAKETRFQILVKSANHTARKRILKSLDGLKPMSGVRMLVDVDPHNML